MAAVMCTDLEPVRAQAYGNWFEFKPGQIKQMRDDIADFLCDRKKEYGFVPIPDSVLDEPNSAESKKIKEEAVARGRQAIVDHLKRLRHNFEVSTQKDIDVSGEKRSYLTEANSAHKEMFRRLALFKKAEKDFVDAQADEIRKYMEEIDGPANGTVAGKINPRGPDLPKPA